MLGPERSRLRVAFDSNLWISLAIGGQIARLAKLLSEPLLQTYACPQLVAEVVEVMQRPKMQRFFAPGSVDAALNLLESGTIGVEISQLVTPSRDPKDDYLLALAQEYQLDYLVTGDKDLLVLGTHLQTEILTFADFTSRL